MEAVRLALSAERATRQDLGNISALRLGKGRWPQGRLRNRHEETEGAGGEGVPGRNTVKTILWGAWVAQCFKHLTSAQVTISRVTSSSPVSSPVRTAQEPGACFRLCVSLSVPLHLVLSLSL